MNSVEETINVMMICPHCQGSFRKNVEYRKKMGLFAVLIKTHGGDKDCPPFIAFIDNNGKHRGSQKIDNIEEEPEINDDIVKNASDGINELQETVRFYHIKVPRKEGRGFEHKVASVTDRAFMSSKMYTMLIEFLAINEEENTFGTITINNGSQSEEGILVYGKYLGMIYTLFWKDQKSLREKTCEDMKGYANLTVEKLLDIYDLMDFFF